MREQNKAPQDNKQPLLSNETGSRVNVINAVQTPLGFFVLALLIIEGGLGLVAGFSSGSDKTYLFVAMVILVFLLVVIVAIMATIKPSALLGKQASREEQKTLSDTQTINPIYSIPRRKSARFAQITVILLIVLAVSGGGFALITGKISPMSKSPVVIAGLYKGSINNSDLNIRTSMSLLINQTQGSINGTFTPGPELLGGGSFTGTVDAGGDIQFKVRSDQVSKPLLFKGTVQSDRSLSGTYCSVDEQNQCDPNAGRGTWNVSKS